MDLNPLVIERLSREMLKWYKKEMGIEPTGVEVTVSDNIFFVRFKGVVTPSEVNLSQKKGGKDLLREIDDRLCESIFPELKEMVREITGHELLDLQVETNLPLNERIYVLTLDRSKGRVLV